MWLAYSQITLLWPWCFVSIATALSFASFSVEHLSTQSRLYSASLLFHDFHFFSFALGWWKSGFWVVCLLFHDMLCCVTAAAWSLSSFFFSSWKPTDFNVRVCIRPLITQEYNAKDSAKLLTDSPCYSPWPTSMSHPFCASHYPTPPTAGLPGPDLLHSGRDRRLASQSPGETSGVSAHFTVGTLSFWSTTP